MTETHFYALKRMKIPVKTASLLTEMLPSVHEAKGEAKYDHHHHLHLFLDYNEFDYFLDLKMDGLFETYHHRCNPEALPA